MKNVTQVLSEEHQNILKFIDTVIDECMKLEEGKEFDKIYFEKAIDFIKNYADRFHHAKEEEILFKAMLKNVEELHCNPIPVMLDEHETGRNYVKGMEDGLSENNNPKVIENAKGYCYLLQEHIYKEDNVLYPMAEEALSEGQKEEVLRKYNEIESKVFADTEIPEKYLSYV